MNPPARPTPLPGPKLMLWAWETPEDLRRLDPSRAGVAYLAESLRLGATVSVIARHQPLLVPPGTFMMPVVRLEPSAGFTDTSVLREQTAAALAAIASRPGSSAFQVDFDATASQREFYAAVLKLLRAKMRAGQPLSVTALLSWCGERSGWLSRLPVDEAVPMYFRLGGTIRRDADKSGYPVNAAVCRGSFGLSTDESWPAAVDSPRLYLFTAGPWTASQIDLINQGAPSQQLHR